MAKDVRATVVVDGVQALPHFTLDIDPAIDFAFFSAYKAYAPHSAFWYASGEVLQRFAQADDAHVPDGDARYWTLETGTQSYEALAGWLGTMAYLRDVAPSPRAAFATIAEHERTLVAHALPRFAERAPRLKLYGRDPSSMRLPVFAFNIAHMAPDELAQRFESASIDARVGDYYAPRLMQTLAPEAKGRAVRLSFAHYNTTEDVDRCFEVLDAILGRVTEGTLSERITQTQPAHAIV
jgi:selenocysteine lyase/cysteine desulfurase